MAIFCEECGHALHEGAQFCGACGHPLAAPVSAAESPPVAPEPAPPEVVPEPVAAEPPPPAPPVEPPPPAPPAVPPVVPPAVPPAAAAPTGPPADGSGGRQKWLLALLGLLVVAVAAVAVALFMGGDSDKASKADREVLLESAASAGPAPFTPTLQPVAATTPTTAVPITTATTVPGTTGRVAQGPFGGTGDNTLCDRELLVEFLTNPANARIAQEWARVLDIQVRDIPTYVRALIPTTLTADARVTNHTFENGRAVGYQAVLQRGTAVLVDTNGRLIARCRCGNPLLPPQEIAQPVYTGPKWEGFDPTVIVVVVPSPTPIYPPGGVGTLPQSTTPTTRKGSTTTTTQPPLESDDAIAKIRTSFEACARAGAVGITGSLSAAEVDQVLASGQYTATLVDQRTGTYRVAVFFPDQTIASGEIGGGTATWDVNLLTGEVTPVDENAQATGAVCADLA